MAHQCVSLSVTTRVVQAWWCTSAPPHFLTVSSQARLWIWCRRAVGGIARCPDLKPLKLDSGNAWRLSVYSVLINNLEVRRQRVEDTCWEKWVKPGIFGVRTSVCLDAWKPHRDFVEIMWTSPISQQALFSGRMLTGVFCSFMWVLCLLKARNQLSTLCIHFFVIMHIVHAYYNKVQLHFTHFA
jgi:hypothetical protein